MMNLRLRVIDFCISGTITAASCKYPFYRALSLYSLILNLLEFCATLQIIEIGLCKEASEVKRRPSCWAHLAHDAIDGKKSRRNRRKDGKGRWSTKRPVWSPPFLHLFRWRAIFNRLFPVARSIPLNRAVRALSLSPRFVRYFVHLFTRNATAVNWSLIF